MAPGDTVEVKDGYGRNYLLPRGLAIVATRGAEKQVETIRRAQEARAIRGLDHAKEVKAALEGLDTVRCTAKAAPARASSSARSPRPTSSPPSRPPAARCSTSDLELSGHIKSAGKHAVTVRLHPDVATVPSTSGGCRPPTELRRAAYTLSGSDRTTVRARLRAGTRAGADSGRSVHMWVNPPGERRARATLRDRVKRFDTRDTPRVVIRLVFPQPVHRPLSCAMHW